MISAEWIYWLAGAFFLGTGVEIAIDQTHPKRWASSAFWALLGISFFYGSFVKVLPVWPLGLVVIALAIIAGTGLTGPGTVRTTTEAQRETSARKIGDALFVPALTIPVVTILFAVGISKIVVNGQPLLAKGQETLVGLGVSVIVALIVGTILLRPSPTFVSLREGRRILESVGWAVLLPQMLTVLGGLFTQAGVGTAVGAIAQHVAPEHSRTVAVIAYALGMALFTIVMGNAFAAFPIMTAAIGWPILVVRLGAHPAPMFAIGMLAGYCGTLCTPMAANFNLVPPALLGMKDKYGQIKVQIPTAIALFAVNVCFMMILPFL
ncbi:MAG TPA: DUF979 domain-containing protein [Candidatus Acidoferrales bacterium]|nr:DUF979 domain-containing protein [Candidatus Acidoferrales bacterium]